MPDLLTRRRAALGPAYRLFYDEPVAVVSGRGTTLVDADGVEYLDAYNNVACVGHSHPAVVEAVSRQIGLVNTNTRYLQQGPVDYAEDLLATLPDEVDQVMFTCTGSEANDLALRVARFVTGATGIVVTANAYHGVTGDVAEISPSLGPAVPLGPHVRTVAPPDRLRLGLDDAAVESWMVAQVAEAVADLHRHGHGVAALVVDCVLSSDGMFPDPAGWLAGAADVVRAAGGLYVADEVQAGFGRLGAGMWGFARHGVVPDVVTMGKPMANGLPLAAAAFRSAHLAAFGRQVRYFNTFGGSTVPIAAAQAVLAAVRAEGLIDNAAVVGDRLRVGAQALAGRFPEIGEVRARGLYVGVDLVRPGSTEPDPVLAGAVVNGLRERRVLISASGPAGNVLKIRPPMVFSAADADRLLTELDAVLAGVAR